MRHVIKLEAAASASLTVPNSTPLYIPPLLTTSLRLRIYLFRACIYHVVACLVAIAGTINTNSKKKKKKKKKVPNSMA